MPMFFGNEDVEFDDRYVTYYLNHVSLDPFISGTQTFQKLTQKSMVNIQIPVPPLEEQKRIARILDERIGCEKDPKLSSTSRQARPKPLP